MTASDWQIEGHDSAIDFLQKSLLHGRNRHAYLFVGAANIGKNALAHSFAAALNCEQEDIESRPCWECASCKRLLSGNHPDMMYVEHDDRTGKIKVDMVRDLMQLLALKPYSSRYRIAILDDFDEAYPQAQDALLKTLEEPAPHAVLLLLAKSTEKVLSTITSRCQLIRLRPAPVNTVADLLEKNGASAGDATLLARLSSGRTGWAMHALDSEEVMQKRGKALDTLHAALMGNRAIRFGIAEDLDKLAKKESKPALHYILEIWQTYWRDLLLLTTRSGADICNQDRADELDNLALQLTPDDTLTALNATREMMHRT
ncbi:MAG: ATP-binding protein, partial [Aggregatilineales bacterium]